MNRQSEHLNDRHIAEYLSQNSEDSPSRSVQWMETHLDHCESCARRVLSAFPALLEFRRNDRRSPGPDPDCRKLEEILDAIASGTHPRETASHHILHAANCDYCGPKLNELLDLYSPEISPDDEELLAELQGSETQARKQIVQKLRKEKRLERSWAAVLLHPLAFGGAAVSVALSIVSFFAVPAFLDAKDKKEIRRLWAEAASSHARTTPTRFSDEPYSAYHAILGPSDNTGDDLNLLRAKLMVESKVPAASGNLDPEWLKLRARVALLEARLSSPDQKQKKLATAEQYLRIALSKSPDDASLRIDLATIYFEEDMLKDPKAPVLARTINELYGILRPGASQPLSPDIKAAALYNLALAYQATGLRGSEATVWAEYQDVDSSSQWAVEAQTYLNAAVKQTAQNQPVESEDPVRFLELLSHPDQEGLDPEQYLDRYLERYIDIAIRKWLHGAVDDPKGPARRAFEKVAAAAANKKHSDPMLKDLLGQLTRADLPAVDALSAAFDDNLNDQYEGGAAEESSAAIKWFASRRNLPGEILARFARAYSLRRSLKEGGDCLAEFNEISRRLPSGKYHWLEGQTELEKAQCANLTWNHKQTEDSVKRSREIAAETNYDFLELKLRVMGIDAGMKRLGKKPEEAWRECVEGLRDYWQRPQSPERLYQFYAVLWQTAWDMKLPYATEALLRQGIRIRETYFKDDLPMLATLHMRLANTLREAGEIQPLPQNQPAKPLLASLRARLGMLPREPSHAGAPASEAEVETKRALELAGNASDKSTVQKYLLNGQIILADAKLDEANRSTDPAAQNRRAKLALQFIEPVSSLLSSQHGFMQLDFYRVRADANRYLSRYQEAIHDYQAALERSEMSLNSIGDDGSRANWVLKTDEIDRGLTWTLLKNKEQNKALFVWERLRSRSLAPDNNIDRPLEDLKLTDPAFVPSAPETSAMHVIYAAFRDGVEIWTVDGPTVKGTWVDIEQSDLTRLVDRFADRSAGGEKTSKEGEELYSKLLKPIIAGLPMNRPVAVELDRALARLPLEALPLPANGEFFGARYQVVRSPGIYAQKVLRKPRPLNSQRPFLFIDPSNFPGHSDQVNAVRHAFPNSQVLGAKEIRKSTIAEALSDSYGFHFTGHATGAELVLAPGLSLKASDFNPKLLQKVQLAVLAACSTGATRNGPLDADSLTRAFLLGGVPSVVTSQWNVDAAATAGFMERFYAHLEHGDGPAAALQKTRKDMISSGDDTQRLPYTWAAFTLNGRTD